MLEIDEAEESDVTSDSDEARCTESSKYNLAQEMFENSQTYLFP